MHLAFFLGESPFTVKASFSFAFLKVEIPLLKINIFQHFKYVEKY